MKAAMVPVERPKNRRKRTLRNAPPIKTRQLGMVPADEAVRREPHSHPFGHGRPHLFAHRRAGARRYPQHLETGQARGAADEPAGGGAAQEVASAEKR